MARKPEFYLLKKGRSLWRRALEFKLQPGRRCKSSLIKEMANAELSVISLQKFAKGGSFSLRNPLPN